MNLSPSSILGTTGRVRTHEAAAVHFWLFPNLLSLDAPAVAVIWFLAFAAGHPVPALHATAALLAATVWIVYAADRLLDTRHLSPADLRSATARHRFCARHRRAFSAALAAALILVPSLGAVLLPRPTLLLALGTAFPLLSPLLLGPVWHLFSPFPA